MLEFKYNDELIKREYERISDLKEGEYMKTAFGPRNFFFIKREEGVFYLYVGEWFLKKVKTKHDVSSWEKFKGFLIKYPEYYAKNVVSQTCIHYDNYENFIKAFKKCNEYTLVVGERYYEENPIAG